MPATAAYSNVIPQIWAARFQAKLDALNIWGGLTNRNYEGEIRNAGDTVKIPDFTGAVTVKDYTTNTDIDSPETASTSTIDFTIDQAKYFNIYVDDIDRVQARPNLMDAFMDRASVKVAETVNSFIYSKFTGAPDVAARITTVGTSAAKLGGGDATKRTAAAQDIIRALSTLKKQKFNNNLRRDTWLVISPDIHEVIEQYLSVNTSLDYGGQTANVLAAGFAGNLLGFNIFVDTNITANADDRYRCFVGTNDAVTFASQITEIIPYRPERRFGDAVKGLYVYDAALVDAKFLYMFDIYYDING